MKIAKKLILLFLLISLLPISIISFFSYTTARESITRQILNELSFIASLQEGRINSIIDQNLERLRSVSRREQLSSLIVPMEQASASADTTAISAMLKDAQSANNSLKDIFILNTEGSVVASTRETQIGQNYGSEEFFLRGKEDESIANFFYDENNNLRVYLTGPIVAGGSTVGVVVAIESDVDTILALIRDYSGLGKTGEILIAQRTSANDAVFIAPSRFNANAALHNIVKHSNTADPMNVALSGKETILPSVLDYRGKRVLASTRYIEKADWGLVVKIDRDEAFGTIYRLRSYFLYTALLTSFLAILNAWYFAHTITKPISTLTEIARRMQAGNFSQHVSIHTNDEIGLLARTFNAMALQINALYSSLEDQVKQKTSQLAHKVQEAQQQIAKDEALLTSIGDGIIATDKDEKIILINTAAEEMLTVAAKDILGKKFSEVIVLGSGTGSVPKEHPIQAVLTRGRKIATTVTDGYLLSSATGKPVAVAITITPVSLANEVIGAILVFRDITVSREIDRMKTEFIYLASHQLRTPLSAIRWFAEMLQDKDTGPLTGEQREMVNNIAAANQRMIGLVNSLLNISRIESGKLTIDKKVTSLSEIMRWVLKSLEEKMKEKNLELTYTVAPSIPQITTDPKLAWEVFNNILTNAIKYTPNGGKITVEITATEKEVLTRITDTGFGIPQHERNRVFQKFYRGENIISRDTEGSGLGLYMVKEIMKALGGDIWFESHEQKGTTFWISVPLAHLPKPGLQQS